MDRADHRFCAHCGAPRRAGERFCVACGSSAMLEAVDDRPDTCHECANPLAESWRYCPRCGVATPLAHHSRSTRTTVDAPPAAEDSAANPAPPFPQRADHLHPTTFADLAARHSRHRNRAASPSPVTPIDGGHAAPEIVEDEAPAPAVELISRPKRGRTEAPATPPPPTAQPTTIEAKARPTAVVEPSRPQLKPVPAEPSPPEAEPEPAEPLTATGQTVRLEAPELTLEGFRDPTVPGRIAQITALTLGLVSTVMIISLIVLNNRIADIGRGEADALDNAAGAADFINGTMRPVFYVAAALAAGTLMLWTAVVYHNLTAFGRRNLRAGTSAALWAWVVPGVNLVLPKRLLDDAWRGAAPDAWRDKDWKLRQGPLWVNVFWWSLMASIALTFVGWRVGDATVETALDANGWAILGLGALIVATLAAVRMIDAVTTRQLELVHGEPPGEPRNEPRGEP